jgi:hypothetical protein
MPEATGATREGAEARLRQIALSAQELRLQRDWSGLSPLAPITAHYILSRGKGGFFGTAEFAVGHGSAWHLGVTENIEVSARAVGSFLRRLANLRLLPGPYNPYFSHTDDFPELRIRLESQAGVVVLDSTSQGQGHVPWRVTIDDQVYVVKSAEPDRALAALERHMKADRLRELIQRAEEQMRLGR